ncbi:MAG: efflux RND transporter periplasmic adaptor subunit [Gammaproteobacteria bacterium]
MSKIRRAFRTSLLAASLGALYACGPSAPPPAQRPPPEVGVLEMRPQPFELSTQLPGRTAAFRVAEVRPQVSGIVQKRLFEEGSTVTAGQALYQIDPAPYQAATQRAAAELKRAQTTAEVARLKAERFAPLARSGAVAKQDNDDVQATYRQALANVDAARAALETARIDLGYTRIQAPIAGVISESYITEGALVTAGQPQRLAQVTQLDPIYVDIQRPTAELLQLRREFEAGRLERAGPDSARIELLLEDGNAYALPGQLQFSGVTVDPGTGSVNLRAVYPNPDHHLLPGMYVRGRLREGVEPAALLVPQRAVTRDAEGRASVLVVGADNKLEVRIIETRRAAGDAWLVGKGLTAGDRVVVRGPLRLMPGMPVNPVPADAKPAAPGAPSPAAPKAAGHG